jgi:hypothetical protein
MGDYLAAMCSATSNPIARLLTDRNPDRDCPDTDADAPNCPGEKTQGTHIYFAPPEFVGKIRGQCASDKWICAEQAVMLESDPLKARTVAGDYMKTYRQRESHREKLRSIDFNDRDFENEGGDRLVDALVPWGGADTLCARVAAQYASGVRMRALGISASGRSIRRVAYSDGK